MQTIPIKNVGAAQLVDSFQREYYYLRLSITDMCNFRCNYCLPDGYQPEPNKPSFLTLDEIRRLVSSFAVMGTEKVRITGGEPTLRKDFLPIVESLRDIDGIKQIALTTNGFRLLTLVWIALMQECFSALPVSISLMTLCGALIAPSNVAIKKSKSILS